MPFDDIVDTLIRQPSSRWVGGYIVTAMMVLMCSAAAAFAVALFVSGDWRAALCAGAFSSWFLVLARYVWRDASARHGWRVGIGYDTIALDLPANRFLMTHAERVREHIPYSSIESIETRTEAWNSLGMTNMQRAYALRLRSGRLVRLGEDRALGTSLADQTVGGMVDKLILRSGLRLRDLGMVEAHARLLGIVHTSMPPWDSPGISKDSTAKAWQRVEFTGTLAGLVTALAIVALVLG
ncbi:MAG: hypothetical protein R3C00_08415 [Hyphomonas sp.]